MTSRYVSAFNALVGSATLPQGSLYSAAAVGAALIEAGFNSGNANQKKIQLQRLTSLGTAGAGQVEGKFDNDGPAASCTAFATHTVAPTLGDRLHGFSSPATTQTGITYGFHDRPVEVPVGTANGIGFLPTTALGGTDVVFVWDEG